MLDKDCVILIAQTNKRDTSLSLENKSYSTLVK